MKKSKPTITSAFLGLIYSIIIILLLLVLIILHAIILERVISFSNQSLNNAPSTILPLQQKSVLKYAPGYMTGGGVIEPQYGMKKFPNYFKEMMKPGAEVNTTNDRLKSRQGVTSTQSPVMLGTTTPIPQNVRFAQKTAYDFGLEGLTVEPDE
jgi:hypothetical protein